MDESKEQNKIFIYSALVLRADRWPAAFAAMKEFRKKLRRDYGIYINKELHAWKFAAGKGAISDRVLSKAQRAAIFSECLTFAANCRHFSLMSSVNTTELYAFERLMNRLNRTAKEKGAYLLLFCDQGQEAAFTRRIRKMRVHNPIPSRYGGWAPGAGNIPLARFVEDPIFKDSEASYFVQLVDFCAYALLRMERPITSRTALGYDTAYNLLKPIAFKGANPNDPKGLGIIR
jgi:hypothetical protein